MYFHIKFHLKSVQTLLKLSIGNQICYGRTHGRTDARKDGQRGDNKTSSYNTNKTSSYNTNKTSSFKTNNTHQFVRVYMSKITHTRACLHYLEIAKYPAI